MSEQTENVTGEKVNFIFEPEAVAALEQMQKWTKLENRGAVVGYGLRWFEFTLEQMRYGGEILFRRSDGSITGVMLPFPIGKLAEEKEAKSTPETIVRETGRRDFQIWTFGLGLSTGLTVAGLSVVQVGGRLPILLVVLGLLGVVVAGMKILFSRKD